MATLLMVLSIILSILILLITSLTPFFALKHNWLGFTSSLFSVTILSLCNCFACGIFLTTCFLGLIPHTLVSETTLRNHLYGQSNSSTVTHNAHIQAKSIGWAMFIDTNLMVLFGFLLIILIEQSTLFCVPTVNNNTDVPMQSSTATDPTIFGPKKRRNRRGSSFSKLKAFRTPPTGRKSKSNQSKSTSTSREIFEPLVVLHDGDSSCSSRESSDSSPDCEFGDFGRGRIEFRLQSSKAQSCHGKHHIALPAAAFNTKSFFLMLAMSFHSFFEGIALGAQHTSAQFIRLFGSIMLHEVLCSFSYGVTLSSQKVSIRMAVLSSVILSLSIPIGIIVMALLGALEETSGLVVKFMLEGLSAGIFIYVACVEMLSHEFSHDANHTSAKEGLLKTGFLFVGCAIAYLFNFIL